MFSLLPVLQEKQAVTFSTYKKRIPATEHSCDIRSTWNCKHVSDLAITEIVDFVLRGKIQRPVKTQSIGRPVTYHREFLRGDVINIYSHIGIDEYVLLPIPYNAFYPIGEQASWIILVIFMDSETVPVVQRDAIPCSEPDKSPVILINGHHAIVGKSVFHSKMVEKQILRLNTQHKRQ